MADLIIDEDDDLEGTCEPDEVLLGSQIDLPWRLDCIVIPFQINPGISFTRKVKEIEDRSFL